MSDLRALGELRDEDIVERKREELSQGAQRRDFQRRARRQTNAYRHIGGDVDFQSRHDGALQPCFFDAPVNVLRELGRRRLTGAELRGLVEIRRVDR